MNYYYNYDLYRYRWRHHRHRWGYHYFCRLQMMSLHCCRKLIRLSRLSLLLFDDDDDYDDDSMMKEEIYLQSKIIK